PRSTLFPYTTLFRSIRPQRRQAVGNRLQHSARGARVVFADAVRRFAAKQCDGALLRPETGLHVQRLPGTLFLVLGDAVGKFSWIAERRHVNRRWTRAPDLQQDQ